MGIQKSKTSLIYWTFQLLGWGHFCSLIGIHRYLTGEFTINTLLQLLWLYILLISLSHGIRFIFIYFDWLNMKINKLIVRVFSLNLITSIVLVLLQFIFAKLFLDKSETFNLLGILGNSLVYMIFFLFWSTSYLLYHLYQKSRLKDLQHLKLEASHHESELKALRDQLNPHFLFNSLNSIRALIELEPTTAKKAITALSQLLRKSLTIGKETLVSLEEELRLVEDYLALEKIRFEERLNFDFKVNVPTSILIPPFLIQNLVENAVKHGISKSENAGKITVEITFNQNDLIILVENTGSLQKKSQHGIGLQNIYRRLNIQYQDQAIFTLREEDNLVKAKVEIKNYKKL